MRIVVDTAILVRGNSRASGPARELVRAIRQSGALLILSPYVLKEIERVLRYPRIQDLFHLDDEAIRDYVLELETLAEVVEPAQGPPVVLKDANDDPVLYTAVSGQADVLCTVDKHFYEPYVLAFCFRRGIEVMSDLQLLQVLRQTDRKH